MGLQSYLNIQNIHFTFCSPNTGSVSKSRKVEIYVKGGITG